MLTELVWFCSEVGGAASFVGKMDSYCQLNCEKRDGLESKERLFAGSSAKGLEWLSRQRVEREPGKEPIYCLYLTVSTITLLSYALAASPCLQSPNRCLKLSGFCEAAQTSRSGWMTHQCDLDRNIEPFSLCQTSGSDSPFSLLKAIGQLRVLR